VRTGAAASEKLTRFVSELHPAAPPPPSAARLSVKSLERRLASVLTQAFDDCPTLRGRFRLLDCFSDLVQRPAIAEELQRKHSLMVQDFAAEVALVMQVRVSVRVCL